MAGIGSDSSIFLGSFAHYLIGKLTDIVAHLALIEEFLNRLEWRLSYLDSIPYGILNLESCSEYFNG